MISPEKNVIRRVGEPTLYERGCHRPIFQHHWLKPSACCQSAPKIDPGRRPKLPPVAACDGSSHGTRASGSGPTETHPTQLFAAAPMNDRFGKTVPLV
jgi:hypothetical protein